VVGEHECILIGDGVQDQRLALHCMAWAKLVLPAAVRPSTATRIRRVERATMSAATCMTMADRDGEADSGIGWRHVETESKASTRRQYRLQVQPTACGS